MQIDCLRGCLFIWRVRQILIISADPPEGVDTPVPAMLRRDGPATHGTYSTCVMRAAMSMLSNLLGLVCCF